MSTDCYRIEYCEALRIFLDIDPLDRKFTYRHAWRHSYKDLVPLEQDLPQLKTNILYTLEPLRSNTFF